MSVLVCRRDYIKLYVFGCTLHKYVSRPQCLLLLLLMVMIKVIQVMDTRLICVYLYVY